MGFDSLQTLRTFLVTGTIGLVACGQSSAPAPGLFSFGDASSTSANTSATNASSGSATVSSSGGIPGSSDPDAGIPIGKHTSGAGAGEGLPASSVAGYVVQVGDMVPTAPGTKVGYALTSPSPKTYQFRWTGEAAVKADGFHEFYGSVWTTGTFTSLTAGCTNQACPLEAGDFVSTIATVAGGQRIDWDTFASTAWDGFSFTTDTEPVYFDVFIDGARHPELFDFPEAPGGATASPATSPFGISSTE